MSRNFRALIIVASTALTGACSISDQKAPGLAGPSSLGMSINMSASPTQLPLDGYSQAVVGVTVTGADGKAQSGVTMTIDNPLPEFGTLTQQSIVTGSDGRASFAWVSIRAVNDDAGMPTNRSMRLTATPNGSASGSRVSAYVDITLTLPGGPNSAPVAAFSFTPSAPEVNASVTFNAGTTTDEGRACGASCTYEWTFGDGGTGTGQSVSHTYTTSGTYPVLLTVTDARGSTGTVTHDVIVTLPAVPTASIVANPSSAYTYQQVMLDGTGSRAATNHRIVRYAWTFGDGNSDATTSATITKKYTLAGSYTARLTVTDELGQSSTAASTTVTVTNPATASFTISPVSPVKGGVQVNFNASASTSPDTISTYAWDFGDSTTATGVTAGHTYATPAANTIYVVRLTITDAAGRTATTTQQLTITP